MSTNIVNKNAISSTKQLPKFIIFIGSGVLAVGLLGQNTNLAILATAVLFLGSWCLWRPGEPPILFVVFGFQWLQASIKVFQANFMGIDVTKLAPYGGDIYMAILLSLMGLAFLALGMRVGSGPWRSVDGASMRDSARLEPGYWFRIYIAAFSIAGIAQLVAWMIPGLTQLLVGVVNLKWAFFWLLAYATFQSGLSRRYFLAAFALEILLGLGGYFSDFKTPLIFTFLAAVAAGVGLSVERQLALLVLVAVALIMGVAWSEIKTDYRDFLSGGAKSQAITVGYSDRMRKLADLASQLDSEKMADGTEKLLSRLSYVDFFGVVISVVPNLRPHEGGALWWDAITRPFMPRLFFPEKTAINDSERTAYYTGLQIIGGDAGTSISIGYMGESYIDFGPVVMMLPIFAYGFLLGSFYRLMLRHDPTRKLLGAALASGAIYTAAFLDSSITKVFGGLVVAMIISFLVLRFVGPRYLSATTPQTTNNSFHRDRRARSNLRIDR